MTMLIDIAKLIDIAFFIDIAETTQLRYSMILKADH